MVFKVATGTTKLRMAGCVQNAARCCRLCKEEEKNYKKKCFPHKLFVHKAQTGNVSSCNKKMCVVRL